MPLVQTPFGPRFTHEAARGVAVPYCDQDGATELRRHAEAAERGAFDYLSAARAKWDARQAATAAVEELRRPEVSRLSKIGAPVFECRASATKGLIQGYGSVFGVRDSYNDVVEPGAFAKSLDELEAKGRVLPMLWTHDLSLPIGAWTVAREDSKGLYLEGKVIRDVPAGAMALSLVESGALSGLSIGFSRQKDVWDPEAKVRRIQQVKLWEVSLVVLPANDDSRIEVVKGAR